MCACVRVCVCVCVCVGVCVCVKVILQGPSEKCDVRDECFILVQLENQVRHAQSDGFRPILIIMHTE